MGGTHTSPSGQAGVGGAVSCEGAADATGAEASGVEAAAAGVGGAGSAGATATGGAGGGGAGGGEEAHAARSSGRTERGGRIAKGSDNAGRRRGNFVTPTYRPFRTESHAPSAIPASAASTQMTIQMGDVRSGEVGEGSVGGGADRGAADRGMGMEGR